MNNFLRLIIRSVEYGAGELTAYAEANGFSGQGSARFHLHEVEAFASALEAYPLPTDHPPKLTGGYLKKGPEGEVEQEHLHLSFYPIGLLGQVGVHVRLASPLRNNDRPESRHAVEVEIRTTYQQLSGFAREVHHLANEEANEAVLLSSTDWG